MRGTVKIVCFSCERDGYFRKVDVIPWRIIGWNLAHNEPYYICDDCQRLHMQGNVFICGPHKLQKLKPQLKKAQLKDSTPTKEKKIDEADIILYRET